MSLSLLPTNAVLINQVAVTVYGVAPGATILSNYEAYAKDNGIDATLNLLLNSAGLGTDANFNSIVLANLGLSGEASAVAYMDSAVAANGRLATMKEAFSYLGSVAGQDNAYGAAGTTFNSKVTKSIEYSSVATNTAYSAEAVSSSAISTGTTFTLTTGADSGSKFTGTDGNDIFNGTLTFAADALAATATLTAGDNITGGAGDDKLQVTVSGSAVTNAGETATISATGIETILVANFDSDTAATGVADAANDVVMDLSNVNNDLTTIGTTSSTSNAADTVFTNVGKIVDMQIAGQGDTNVTFTAATVSGVADVATVTLNGTGTSSVTPVFTTNGIETLNIVSSTSANYVNVSAAAYTSIDVSGDQALTIVVADADVVTFDASDATGTIDVDLTAQTVVVSSATSIVGGSGDSDIVRIDDTAGGNALVVNSTTNDLSKISGFETIGLAAAATSLTLSADTAGVSKFDLQTDTGQQTLTLNSGYTLDTTVSVDDGDTVTNAANVGLTVTGKASLFDNTTTVTGGSGTDTMTITADTGTVELDNVTKVESITVVANKAGTGTVTFDVNSANSTVASGKSLTVDASALTNSSATISFTGTGETDGTFILTGGAGADTLIGGSGSDTIVGGAGADAALTGAAGNDSIDGGAGNDTIDGGAGNDILVGGAGVDSITAGAGNDSISAGDGNDTIDLAGNLTSADTIDGGDGTDTLVVTSVSTAALGNVSNVETLAVSGAASLSLTSNLAFSTLDLTTGSSTEAITFATGYTSDTTVKIDGGDDVTNTAADITLTVKAKASDLEAADNSVLTGSDKSGVVNTLIIDNDTTATVDMQTDISDFDVVTVTDGTTAGADLTIDVTSYGVAGDTLSIDASVLGSDEVVTITGASTADLTVTSGAAADTLVLGTGKDNLDGGAGNDTITASTNITYEDTIAGGEGTDTMTASALTDIDLMNTTGVERLTLDGTNTLGTYASAGGVNRVTVTGGDSVDATGMTTGLTLIADALGNNDTLTGGQGDDIFSFSSVLGLQDGDVINGTTGTDTVRIDNSSSRFTGELDLDDVTNIDTVTVADADGDSVNRANLIDLTISAIASTTAASITIDASAITDSNDAVTITNSAATTTTEFNILGGAGADVLAGSNDNDTISGGSGADTISGGNKADTFTGGAGADVFMVASGESVFGTEDTITDFTTLTDDINITVQMSTATLNGTLNTSTTGVNMSAYLASSEQGEAVYDSANGVLVVDLNGDGAIGGNDVFVTTATVAAKDITYDALSGGATVETLTLTSLDNGIDRYYVEADVDSVNGAIDIIKNFDADEDIIVIYGTENTANDFQNGLVTADLTAGVLTDEDNDGDSLEINLQSDTSGTAVAAFDGDNYQLGYAGAVFQMTTSSIVTGSNNVDYITAGGTAATITSGKGSDVIDAATSAATIKTTGGVGFGVDLISNFTTSADILDLDISDIEALADITDLVDFDQASVAASNLVISGTAITAAYDLVAATGDDILTVANINTAEELETALEVGGSRALTLNGAVTTLAAGDAFLVAYDNGVDTTIAVVSSSAAVANDATFASGTLTATDIVRLVGVADAGSLSNAADFNAIA